MAIAVSRARNIAKTITFNREGIDALETIARGRGISLSAAVQQLIELHAGVAIEQIEELRKAPVFELERWRSRKLTRDLASLVAGAVREGMTRADAYRAAEVSPKQGAAWEKKGRDDIEREHPSIYADLVSSLERARAEFNYELIQEARRKGDYKTLLKLIDPEQFALPSRSEVDVTHRWQMLIDWDRLTIEKSKLLVALLREASPLEDDPAVTRTARPALEAIPEDVAGIVDAEDADWTEAPVLEAPALEKPHH